MALAVVAPVAAGQEPPQPEVVRLKVSPAAAPRGALRVRLLPKYLDRRPGNRAAMYYRAIVQSKSVSPESYKAFYDDWQKWHSLPVGQLPREQVKKRLEIFRPALEDLQAGAWREQCEWDLRMREMRGLAPLQVRLEEMQSSRHFVRVLSLRCRLEIAEGRLDDAQRTLKTMFQLSRDMAQTPTLVSALVGIALAGVTAADVREFIQHPHAPNLYWALTALPRPLVPMREALEAERAFPLQMFPFLRDVEKKRTPEQWRQTLLEVLQNVAAMEDGEKPSTLKADLLLTALLIKGYPAAKRALIKNGRDRKQVEAMPVAQAVALHLADSYHYAWGEMFKCCYLPYPEAIRQLELADKRLKTEGFFAEEIIPLARLLMPAIGACIYSQARADRQIAELRVIEALRMHAAEHDRWPKSLEEVKQVPVPDDPMTGKAFEYRLEGDTAVLVSSPPPGKPLSWGRKYEVTR